ncbi:regulator of G-protein signaling 3-like isoform X1 [Anarrhichthys ocellatus]|uniref:regulator of G-protein signaling 3-like isoform X1 n=1 Tax=Anarrhichthys ocellatus TaxID=433405 RepID=UPI0012EDEE41|nr:regulator of G-protein signaling 3-like isoform X1 [Anarrhichthys ocellatus]
MRSCDSYVKMEVISDLCVMMKTPTVLNNKNPEYNSKFKLRISDDLYLKRLLISVFSRCSQLIGCLSFGISSLVSSSKLVTGWFYLLGEEFGQSKHLRVTSQRNRTMRNPEDVPAHSDLRRAPYSTSDTDLNHIPTTKTTTAATTNLNHITTTGLKVVTDHSLDLTNPIYSSYVSTLCVNINRRQATQQLPVNVVRGKDGFGFTIFSDCPVKVQAVDTGGPAHRSGLRHGDSVLQLNGLPVETWKCVDLANTIRSCSSQIVLVVWRGGLPELRSGCEALLRPPTHNQTTGRKLLPHPAHSKHGRRWGQGSGVRSSWGALGSLWRDRKEDHEEEEEQEEDQEVTEYSSRTTTLKGTRVTSSDGDNYIILSPVNPGGQLLQPVYHDSNGTLGRLYQTHPSRGQNLLHDPPPGSSRRLIGGYTSTLPPPPSSSSAPPSNYGNYQNCTIVQSHLPCPAYGTYVTLEPKTLIFPIFVQPLDLCSPDRTLLMSEEMVLHQAHLLPAKVTVLIYSDLMLFTREDEAGRCNVLQSPLYLNTLQLREVPSQPLHIFLQTPRLLFSLQTFSIDQRLRVSLCLRDNVHLQLVANHQLSDLPSDLGVLSLGQCDLLPCSSSDPPLTHSSSSQCDAPSSAFSSSAPPIFSTFSPSSPPSRTFTTTHKLLPQPSSSSSQRSPVWKETGGAEEERRKNRCEEVEERQQGEGEITSETSENVGGVRGRGFNRKEEEEESDDEEEEEEELTFRPAVLRRSLSEGSLLKEPRSPHFLSDSTHFLSDITIHRLTRHATSDLDPDTGHAPRPPSIHALRKQLTKEGGSLHHMLVLLNGTKDTEFRNLQMTKKTKSLAADVRSRLLFLRQRKNSTCSHSNSLEKALRNNRPSTGEVLRWAPSLEALLTNQYGLAVFRHFLRSEFSEENLDFWLAVERFKRTHPLSKMAARAAEIYDEFISTNASRQVNVDSSVRESTNQSLRVGVNHTTFQLAQDQILGLMESDSYPRFLRSRLYTQLANKGRQTTTETSNQSAAGSLPVSQS